MNHSELKRVVERGRAGISRVYGHASSRIDSYGTVLGRSALVGESVLQNGGVDDASRKVDCDAITLVQVQHDAVQIGQDGHRINRADVDRDLALRCPFRTTCIDDLIQQCHLICKRLATCEAGGRRINDLLSGSIPDHRTGQIRICHNTGDFQ